MSSLEYRALTRVDAGGTLEFNTLLFARFWQSWGFDEDPPRTMRIMDLGRVQSASIDFFSNFPCYLTLADAVEALSQVDDDEAISDTQLQAQVEALIPLQAQPYDLVLLWDSLNHLPQRIFPLVYHHLRKLCHSQTRLHGFLHTSQMQYDRPWQYRILSCDRMASLPNPGQPLRTGPMNSLTLMNRMPGFAMHKSVLMRNGMQEFILQTQQGQGKRLSSP